MLRNSSQLAKTSYLTGIIISNFKKLLHFTIICDKILKLNKVIRVWRSLVARLNGVQEAAGSTPVTRTIGNPHQNANYGYLVWFSFFSTLPKIDYNSAKSYGQSYGQNTALSIVTSFIKFIACKKSGKFFFTEF